MTDSTPPPAMRILAQVFIVLIPLLITTGLLGMFVLVLINKYN